MEIILSAPYIIRVFVSLFVILAVNKLVKQLWIAVIIGTAVLAVWCGHSVAGIAEITWQRISSPNTIFLLVIIFQIIWLSSQMSQTGVMKDLVQSVKNRISQRASMALLPALIGLLPMPGGAIFSAPLVDECDEGKSIDPVLKTRINYWFRHVWEYWWPLYPGFLLAVDLTGLPIVKLMALNLPLSIVSIFAGYFFLLRKVKNEKNSISDTNSIGEQRFFLLILPIIIIIASYAFIKMFIPGIGRLNQYMPMSIGILIAQIFLQIYRPISGGNWKKILLSPNTVMLALLVLLVLIYGSFIGAKLPDGSLLVTQMRVELGNIGIPIFFIIIIIPFICGFITGIAIGFVGASFPIVLSLIGVNPSGAELLATTVLAYGSGYMGMILSPVHICLIVTAQHFQTSIGTSIFRLIKPALVILAASVTMYFGLLEFL